MTKDKRGREWEIFQDLVYYDLWCVRQVDDRQFDSPLSFHFEREIDAINFLALVSKSL